MLARHAADGLLRARERVARGRRGAAVLHRRRARRDDGLPGVQRAGGDGQRDGACARADATGTDTTVDDIVAALARRTHGLPTARAALTEMLLAFVGRAPVARVLLCH